MRRLRKFEWPIVVFFVGFLFRLLPAIWSAGSPGRFLEPDSYDYLRLARGLAASGFYGDAAGAELFRAPGYPVFLLALGWLGVNSNFAIVLVQAVLGAATCVAAFFLSLSLTRRLGFPVPWRNFAAVAAAVLLAVSDNSIVAGNMVLAETLFTFLLVLLVLGCEKIAGDGNMADDEGADISGGAGEGRGAAIFDYTFKRGWLLVALALAAGFLTLIRAIFLPLLPLVAVYLGWRRRSWRLALLFLLCASIPPLGWSFRNWCEGGYFGVSTVGAINLYRYNACALEARRAGRSFADMQGEFTVNLENAGGQREQAEFAKREGKRIILENPVQYAIIHLRANLSNLLPGFGDLARLFGVEVGGGGTLAVVNSEGLLAGVRHYFRGHAWLLALAAPFALLLAAQYAVCLTAAYAIIRKHRCLLITFFFHLMIIAWFLGVPGPASHPRFRVPVEPLLCVYAAIGIYFVISGFNQWRAEVPNDG